MVVLICYSLTNKDDLSKPEKFIKDSVGWVQGVVYKPVDLIAGSLSSIKELKATYEENQLLREKNSEYKTLVYDNQSLEKENEELRETLEDRKSTRLNSSHVAISYAVFCLKKKKRNYLNLV